MFENKIVVITGGTDGIGKALVSEFLSLGASVATCARNAQNLFDLKKEFDGKPLFTMEADVSKEEDCKNFILQIVNKFNRIDILINNAGISMRGLFRETNLETLRRVMDINFWGSVYCTKFALDIILENKGTIVGMSSVAGYRGLPGRSAYSASKFALQGWLEAIKTELAGDNVHVMWISPGFTTSNIRNAALTDKGKEQGESPMDENKMMTAEECASRILNAVKKKKRSLVMTFTGKETVFMQKFFPGLADKFVRKFYFKEGKLIK